MNGPSPLRGVVVTELGGREAVGVCGSLLAHLGATVIVVEPTGHARERDAHRAPLVAGKMSLGYDDGVEQDRALIRRLVERSDVVLTSSDIDARPFLVSESRPANVVCDLTAFGSTGPLAGEARTEAQLQALSGIMHTTGPGDGPPLPISVPVIGYATGTYAAAAVLAALRVRRRDGSGQRVEVAMFDAAFVSLNVFLTGVLTGQVSDRTRLGNRHPTMAPWNLYQTADGWILICTGNLGQWERLCALMGRRELAGQFQTMASRMLGIEEIDRVIGEWTRTLSTTDCVERVLAAGVPSGPITPIDRYPREANLEFRGMIRTLWDPVSTREVFVPASPLGLCQSPPVQPQAIPAPGADRATIERIASELRAPMRSDVPTAKRERPLAGIRVVEVGQYTTAPLCARHLAHLGADVIKVEKPGGDESRAYAPVFGGRSETYVLNNADKRGMVLDLLSQDGRQTLKELLRTADVLVENNKPGTLAKFGLSAQVLAEINPRLVYCAISGFGARSMYADRPGFDTVIQAMSGFMTALHPGGEPFKSGISTADVLGAQMGIVAILGALEHRDRTGRGQAIDLSMQDVACWLTAAAWNTKPEAIAAPVVVRCVDGFVLVDRPEEVLERVLRELTLTIDALAAQTRSEVAARLSASGLPVAPVNSVREACEWPHTRARGVWRTMAAYGLDWPILASPLRMQLTPTEVSRFAPDLNEDGEAVLRELRGMGVHAPSVEPAEGITR